MNMRTHYQQTSFKFAMAVLILFSTYSTAQQVPSPEVLKVAQLLRSFKGRESSDKLIIPLAYKVRNLHSQGNDAERKLLLEAIRPSKPITPGKVHGDFKKHAKHSFSDIFSQKTDSHDQPDQKPKNKRTLARAHKS